jgi:outer membrane receptor for ferrienterochelin and colicin
MKYMNWCSKSGLVAFATLTCNAVFSQENPKDLESLSLEALLNVKVTTVSKTSQKAEQAPATVIVVTAEQIRLRGYRNLAEVLNDLPDFKVNDKSDPQNFNVINARGISRKDLFIIMLDGIRISSPTNEPLPVLENFPIYLAKQIEVVYGPGSALYGADAMAGVINIITEKGTQNTQVKAGLLGGTHGYGNGSLQISTKLKNNFLLTVAGQYTYDAQPDFSKVYSNEYNMTAQQTGVFNSVYGPMRPTQPVAPGYEAPIKTYNVYTSLEKGGFSLTLLHHYAQTPSSTTLKPDNGVYNKENFYGQGVTTVTAGYTDSIGKLRTTTTLTESFYRVNPRSNYRNLYGNMQTGYKYSTGSMLKLEEQLGLTISKQLDVIGGITYERFQSVPKSPELQAPVKGGRAVGGILLNSAAYYNPQGIGARFFPLLYDNIGVYLQAQYAPVKKLAFTAGVRFDHNSRFGSTTNPRIGAVYNPAKTTTIKALYGTAYWAPSPMIAYETYGSFYTQDSGRTYTSSFLHLPNPGLKPITSRTFELSVNQKIGRHFTATITAYSTKVNNLISALPDNGNTNLYNNQFLGYHVDYIEVPVNIEHQDIYGGNIMLNSSFHIGSSRINAWSSASFVDGFTHEYVSATESKNVQMPLIAPWQFRAGIDGKSGSFYYSARLLLMGKQRVTGFTNEMDRYERQTMAGYTQLNLSVGYTLNEKVTFYVNAQNALNQRYRVALDMNLNDNSAATFKGALQDPLRVMAGARITIF